MTASFTRSGRAKYDQRLYPLIPDHYCCTYRIMSIKSAHLPIADWSSYSRTRGRVLLNQNHQGNSKTVCIRPV